jgi:AcrR family transcriptional regulator
MKNKEIQEQRMKGYFLQATKEILKAEGLKGISVRSIADKAGYSYATLYSYFKDINDLIFLCVHDFYEECKQHVKEHPKKGEKGIKRLKTAILAYGGFFVQYPGVFDLFFIEKMSEAKGKKAVVDVINFSLDRICEEEWNYCISRNIVKVERVELMKGQIRTMVFGLLLLYLNRRTPVSYTEFINQFNTQLDAILEMGSAVRVQQGEGGQPGNSAIHNSLISIRVGNNG